MENERILKPLNLIYKEQIVTNLYKNFNFSNKHEVPKLIKIQINRGLGIDAKEFKSYFSALKNDNYCLIIRGRSSELAAIEAL